jgi:hypothetical protein
MTLPPSPCHLSEEEIMIKDIEKIEKARLIIQKIADGTNPINGQPVEADSFLHDSRITRCFYFISEVLEAVVKGTYSNKKINDFVITDEQKNKVVFTEGNIGVNEAARCINLQLNPLMSKKVTGAQLNKGLKRLGILSEAVEDGKEQKPSCRIFFHHIGFPGLHSLLAPIYRRRCNMHPCYFSSRKNYPKPGQRSVCTYPLTHSGWILNRQKFVMHLLNVRRFFWTPLK